MPPEKLVYTFTGDGTKHVLGVPARDLTEADIASLGEIDAAELTAHLSGDEPVYGGPKGGQRPDPSTVGVVSKQSSPQGEEV